MHPSLTKTIAPLRLYPDFFGNVHSAAFSGVNLNLCNVPLNCCTQQWSVNPYNNINSLALLSKLIAEAENEILECIKMPVGRTWVCGEEHIIGDEVVRCNNHNHYFRSYGYNGWGLNGIDNFRNYYYIDPDYRNIINSGRESRLSLPFNTQTLTYSDADNDGLTELSTVVITNISLANIELCELQYYPDGNTEQACRIWPLTESYNKSTKELTLTFRSWDLIRADILAGSVLNPLANVNLCCDTELDPAECDLFLKNEFLYSQIEVLHVFNDGTQAGVEFSKTDGICSECGSNCVCGLITQPGCFIGLEKYGILAHPANYDENEACWVGDNSCDCDNKYHIARLWYEMDCFKYCAGDDCNGLDYCPELVRAAFLMATARMPQPCGCDVCSTSQIHLYREYVNKNTKAASHTWTPEILNEAKFGLRWGELEAYNIVKNFSKEHMLNAAVIIL